MILNYVPGDLVVNPKNKGSGQKGRELNSETRHELMLMAQFCVMGVTLKAIAAQAEAKEMEEAWE